MKNVKKWFKKAAAALLAVLRKCTWTLDSGVLTISGNGAMGNHSAYSKP